MTIDHHCLFITVSHKKIQDLGKECSRSGSPSPQIAILDLIKMAKIPNLSQIPKSDKANVEYKG